MPAPAQCPNAILSTLCRHNVPYRGMTGLRLETPKSHVAIWPSMWQICHNSARRSRNDNALSNQPRADVAECLRRKGLVPRFSPGTRGLQRVPSDHLRGRQIEGGGIVARGQVITPSVVCLGMYSLQLQGGSPIKDELGP